MLGFLKRKKTAPAVSRDEEPEVETPIPGLHSGMLAQVLSMDDRRLFTAVVEVRGRDMLQLRDEAGDPVPMVEYNTKIKLRLFRQNEWTMALRGQVCGSTEDFWRIDRLEKLQMTEKREYFRQKAQVEGQVWSQRSTVPARCQVLDVSAGGILIRCQESFLVGQIIRLNDVCLAAAEDPFRFNCRIVRAVVNGSYVNYGCQFEGLSAKEEDRLMRAILSLQRKSLQSRRG